MEERIAPKRPSTQCAPNHISRRCNSRLANALNMFPSRPSPNAKTAASPDFCLANFVLVMRTRKRHTTARARNTSERVSRFQREKI